MTKKQARKKTRTLINNSAKLMREKLEKALNCGAINLDAYEDDFELPRIIVTALLRDAVFNFSPKCWSETEQRKKNREINNLYGQI